MTIFLQMMLLAAAASWLTAAFAYLNVVPSSAEGRALGRLMFFLFGVIIGGLLPVILWAALMRFA